MVFPNSPAPAVLPKRPVLPVDVPNVFVVPKPNAGLFWLPKILPVLVVPNVLPSPAFKSSKQRKIRGGLYSSVKRIENTYKSKYKKTLPFYISICI